MSATRATITWRKIELETKQEGDNKFKSALVYSHVALIALLASEEFTDMNCL